MSVVPAVRGVLWARRRRPDDVRYMVALAHERFPPVDLLQQAVEAEQAGFDGVCCSDHLAPWWSDETAPTSSGNAWVWLGAAANATTRVALGTGVTALVHRYNPVVVAQQLARTEEALTIITRLLDGETVDFEGEYFRAKRAVLYARPARRPPIYMSAFYEGA